jgi:hypothetical protein
MEATRVMSKAVEDTGFSQEKSAGAEVRKRIEGMNKYVSN